MKCASTLSFVLPPGKGLFTSKKVDKGDPICIYTRGPLYKSTEPTLCHSNADFLFYFVHNGEEMW